MSNFELNDENYYSPEAGKHYLSFHRWLELHGSIGILPCEAKTKAIEKGEWVDDSDNKPLLIGQYVDSYLTGSEQELEEFKKSNPDIFTLKKDIVASDELMKSTHPEWFNAQGKLKTTWTKDKISEVEPSYVNYHKELKAEYKMADKMIERVKKDELFMRFLDCEHQKIFTTEMFGAEWCCKLDCYQKGGWIADLKTCASITDSKWGGNDIGHLSFIEFYGYDIQLAVYQEIVYRCTGEKLPCYILAVSKQKHPRIEVIEIPDLLLYNGLNEVRSSLEHSSLLDVWQNKVPPTRCERDSCDYCADTRKLMRPIDVRDLLTNF